MKLPDSHRNRTMEDKKIYFYGEAPYWVCDNCHEARDLGGRWVYLCEKYICEECICFLFKEQFIDTKHIRKVIREELLENAKCPCGSIDNLEIDHIHPRSKGGKSVKGNLQVLCKKCNTSKGDKIEMVQTLHGQP